MTGTQEQFDGNHHFWEQAAAAHGTGSDERYYHLDRVVAGGTLMTRHEERALARATGAPADSPLSALRGRHVLHLQSHIGVDGVVMARAGAHVTCADFSPTALARARALAEQVGVDIDTIEVDARDLPVSLHGRFDIVYVTIGAICWIDDLDTWLRQVALALRPGGRLVMVEMHPVYAVFDAREPELVADFPYGGGRHYTDTSSGTYSDPTIGFESTTTCYAHSLGEIVTGAVAAGLCVDLLEEHTDIAFDPRGDAVVAREADGQYRLRLGRGRKPGDPGEALPVLFTLLATRA